MRQKKRVLIVSEFFPRSDDGEARGGVEMRSWQISKRISSDFEVVVLASNEYGLTSSQESFSGIKVARTGPRRDYAHQGVLWSRFRFMISVYRKCLQIDPDIIDAQSFVTYLPVYLASLRLDIPAIATYHDVWRGRWKKLFGITGLIGEIYEKFILKSNWSAFIANSYYTKDNLVKAGVDESKVSVIPNGIDIKQISSISVKKYDLPTICSITRLVPYKKVLDLVKAVERIKQQIPDIQCKIIGSGPEMEKINHEISTRNLSDNIELLGFVKSHTSVLEILRKSHVFCLTSSVEGFGIVVAEAMASEIPVVATNIPPIKEVTDNGRGALLYKVGDIESLVKKLLNLLKDRDLANMYILEGRRISQSFDWDNLSQKIINLYKTKI